MAASLATLELLRLRIAPSPGRPLERQSLLVLRLDGALRDVGASASVQLACNATGAPAQRLELLHTAHTPGAALSVGAGLAALEPLWASPALWEHGNLSAAPPPPPPPLVFAARCERCEQLERSRAASLSLRGCAVRVRGAGAGASHELRPVWRRAAHEALQWHRAAPPAAAAAAAPPPLNATEPNATARPRITRAVVGWSGDALRHRMAAATRLRRRVRAHTELRQGVAEMACRQRVAHEIAEGTTHEVTSMFALSLTAGTEGFLKAIFDAVILPLVDILIYLLVLLLVILIGMGFIMRMVAVLMWTMPLAMELTLGPVVSNMLCALLTFCLRITVSDGVSETITKLMDALLMGALAQAISMVAGPAITHKIVALSTKPLTFAAARSITTDLTHAVTHGLTHSVTHAIIHKYYCQVSTRRPAPPIAAAASSTSHTLPSPPLHSTASTTTSTASTASTTTTTPGSTGCGPRASPSSRRPASRSATSLAARSRPADDRERSSNSHLSS